jgi:aerobic carbon-monoxide dehydrogenase small subunit
MTTTTYRLRVNGTVHAVVDGWAGENLLYVLRERLGLPGAKNACEQGECGSCSILVDGVLECACLVLACSVSDSEVTTVEAVEAVDDDGALSDVQRAFVAAGAVQCGFCTPGLVMAVHDLLARDHAPDELELREAISGNLCRCTGYGRILQAVRDTVRERTGDAS